MPLIIIEGEMDLPLGKRRQRSLRADEITAVHPIHENDRPNGHARPRNGWLSPEDCWVGDDLIDRAALLRGGLSLAHFNLFLDLKHDACGPCAAGLQ